MNIPLLPVTDGAVGDAPADSATTTTEGTFGDLFAALVSSAVLPADPQPDEVGVAETPDDGDGDLPAVAVAAFTVAPDGLFVPTSATDPATPATDGAPPQAAAETSLASPPVTPVVPTTAEAAVSSPAPEVSTPGEPRVATVFADPPAESTTGRPVEMSGQAAGAPEVVAGTAGVVAGEAAGPPASPADAPGDVRADAPRDAVSGVRPADVPPTTDPEPDAAVTTPSGGTEDIPTVTARLRPEATAQAPSSGVTGPPADLPPRDRKPAGDAVPPAGRTAPDGATTRPVATPDPGAGPAVPVTETGAAPVVDGPRDTSGVGPSGLERVVDAIRELAGSRPPRSIAVRLDDLGGVRVTVSLRSDGIHLSIPGARPEHQALLGDLTAALNRAGFDLAGSAWSDTQGHRGSSPDPDDAEARGMPRPRGRTRATSPPDDAIRM